MKILPTSPRERLLVKVMAGVVGLLVVLLAVHAMSGGKAAPFDRGSVGPDPGAEAGALGTGRDRPGQSERPRVHRGGPVRPAGHSGSLSGRDDRGSTSDPGADRV